MNLPAAAALPVPPAGSKPFTGRLPDQPGQYIPAEVTAVGLGSRPAHTAIMATLTAPAPAFPQPIDTARR
jgi:hypothetical protein